MYCRLLYFIDAKVSISDDFLRQYFSSVLDISSVTSVYSVFRVIKPGDRMASMRLCFAGERALQDGERSRAARYARAAFLLDPASEQARILYFKVYGDIPKLGLNGLYTETSRRRIPRDA